MLVSSIHNQIVQSNESALPYLSVLEARLAWLPAIQSRPLQVSALTHLGIPGQQLLVAFLSVLNIPDSVYTTSQGLPCGLWRVGMGNV